ncbi:MAG TPA: DUF934 domain-containing protein [Nevskiaceae bacterium]|nr:DUF934 domain-containing protein [Nevskiaceae bacterium]
MTILTRDGNIVANDYALLADDAGATGAAAIVTWQRWMKERESLRAAVARIGVRLPNTLDVIPAFPDLADRPLLELEFPAFADGRAYSQARLLRQRCKYQGEIRAVGNAVVRDQLFGMARCGFDSFELRADQNASVCVSALRDFSLAYQPAADGIAPVGRLRWGG